MPNTDTVTLTLTHEEMENLDFLISGIGGFIRSDKNACWYTRGNKKWTVADVKSALRPSYQLTAQMLAKHQS